jgi:hypothetical protein
VAAFTDLWSKLAVRYHENDHVIFGLMNEPNPMPTELWLDLGWTYWVAGPWWNDYIFTVEPDGNKDRPQMDVLSRHVP